MQGVLGTGHGNSAATLVAKRLPSKALGASDTLFARRGRGRWRGRRGGTSCKHEVGLEVQRPGCYTAAVHRSGTIALVGRPNVGKSTLLNAALGQPISIVSPVPQTTRHGVIGVVRRKDAELILVDTPGIHRPVSRLGRALNRTARAASQQADVVVFVAEVGKPRRPPGGPARRADDAAGRRSSKQGGKPSAEPADDTDTSTSADPRAGASLVHPGDRTLLADIGASAPTVLAINKIDRLRDKGRLLPLLQAFSTLREFVAIVPISAIRDDGVEQLLDVAAAHLPERPPRFADDTLTTLPSRFFAAEFIREQILLSARNEVPHATAVQIQRFEQRQEGGTTHIDALIVVEREGQKAILIGKGGGMLKAIGTQARARIEELLESRVQLSLWVQVSPGWTESGSALADFGYEDSE